MLTILRFIAKMSIKYGLPKAREMAAKKYGKVAIKQIDKKTTLVKSGDTLRSPTSMLNKLISNLKKKPQFIKSTKKPVPKSKPVKKVTELQRVKAQIKRDKLNPRLKVKEPKGKIVGKVRRNYGKWEPVHRKPKKPKKP